MGAQYLVSSLGTIRVETDEVCAEFSVPKGALREDGLPNADYPIEFPGKHGTLWQWIQWSGQLPLDE